MSILDDLCSYRLFSPLSFLSKLTERVVKSRLTDFLSSNHFLNTFQPAYIKSHAIETTLPAVRDRIIKAIGQQQQVTDPSIFDLSGAFYVNVRSLPLYHHSSQFDITGIALCWTKSYLTSGFLRLLLIIHFIPSCLFFLVFLKVLSLVVHYSFFILFP